MAVIQKQYNYMAFPQAFSRGNGIPLDNSSLWYSFEEMENYSKTSVVAYVGQILTLVNEEDNSAKAYIIANAAGDLQEVGSATVGDNRTIVLKDDGALALKNWGVEYYRWVDAVGEEGQEGYVAGHHEKQVVDAEHPWIAGLEPKAVAGAAGTFELAWYQPSTTTIEGLSSTVSTIRTSVDEINAALGNAETEGTIRYDIAGKLDKSGGTMTGELKLSDNSKAASEAVVDAKIAEAIGSAGHLKRAIVKNLPEVASADADTIYMVKNESITTGDAYKEYMLINGAFAQIGDTSVNLEPYATKVYADEKAGEVQTALGTHEADAVKHITADERTAWNNKVDKAEGKSLISDTLITKVEGLANVKSIGSNLTLSDEGVLSAQDSYQLPIASNTVLGGVMVDGVTIKADATGKISVPAADGSKAGLLSKEDFVKVQNIEAGAQKNVIDSVDEAQFAIDGEKKLSLLDVAMSKITGLAEALAGKVAVEEGKSLVSDTLITKLEGIEAGAQANKIESVKVGGTALNITDKSVDIPVATNTVLGAVMSSAAENKVTVGTDGIMEVNSLNINKLVQTDGDYLILDGGNADGSNILINNLNVNEVSY